MANAQRLQLGDILVQKKVITTEQLNRALKSQKQFGGLLGQALVKLGFCTDDQIAIAIASQLGIPYASRENALLKVEKNQGLDKILTEKFARDNMVLPLFLDVEDGRLAVAMCNPDNLMVLENIKVMTGYEISPFITTQVQILKAIDEFYLGMTSDGNTLIDRAMQRADDDRKGEGDGVTTAEVDTSGARLDLDKVLSTASGTGAVAVDYVNAVLKQAISERTSDIHLESFDERVVLRFRIDGVLFERTPPTPAMYAALVSRIKILSKLDIAERRLPQDGEFSMKVQSRIVDVRVSICPTAFGEKVVLRILDKGAVNLDVTSLGFEAKQREDFLTAAQYPHGLLFLTGPTGSGKTTTLYAVLNTIKTPEKNFMTIEDPVEIKLEGINQVQVRAKIGLTFASALRSFLRQDPDVILVGEVRDQETAETCLRASLTGHLVLSTLHTNSALEAVIRLIDLGIEPFLLSSSLALVAAQRLVRILCPACKVRAKPDPKQLDVCLKECALPQPPAPSSVFFFDAKGCPECAGTGYRGRKGIYEVFLISPEMRDIIYRHGADLNRLKESAARSGMWNLRASGWRKVLQGLTTPDEVLSVTLGDY